MEFDFYDQALLSTEEVEMWLGEEVESIDHLKKKKIEFLVNAASSAIQDYCDRGFNSSLISGEIHDGQGSDLIVLRNYPVQEVTELKLKGMVMEKANYYVTEQGAIMLKNGYRTPRGRGSVEVSYVAGYQEIPYAIKQACFYQFQHLYNGYGDGGNLGVSMRGKMGETERKDSSIAEFGLIAEVIGLIKRYKRLESPNSVMFPLGG